jgi:hypothetical protein
VKLELSDMLTDAKSNPPPPRYSVEDAVAAGRKRQRRLRAAWTGAGSAAAVVAVAAAIAVPQIVANKRPTGPGLAAPAASGTKKQQPAAFAYPADKFSGNIVGFTSGELKVSPTVHVTPGYQVAVIVGPGHGTPVQDPAGKIHQTANDVGQVVVYRKGAFDPSKIESGERATVNGNPGFYQKPEVLQPADNKLPAGSQQSRATLTWQYADNAWAVVSANANANITKQQLVVLAGKVTSGTPEPAKVGFRLSYVPAGFQLAAAGASDGMLMAPLDGESYVLLLKGTFPYRGLTAPAQDPYVLNDKQVPMMQLAVYPTWYGKYSPPAGKSKTAPFCASQSLCYRITGDGKYEIELNGGGAVPDAELIKMLDSVNLADPTDTGTWFKATDAVS